MFNSNNKNKGFTLIELSIVIVIIGMIVSGTLVSASLIESAKRADLISYITSLKTATKAFKLEYNKVPGDFTQAYDYWGASCGNDSSNNYNGCNGDGDGCIDSNSFTSCSSNSAFIGDQRRFFLHLNLSEIMPNAVAVTNTTTTTNCQSGIDFPNHDYGRMMPSEVRDNYNNLMLVSSGSSNEKNIYAYFFTNRVSHNGNYCLPDRVEPDFIKPKSLKNIDSKIDDGDSRKGLVRSIYHPATDAYSTNRNDCDDGVGSYSLDVDEPTCGFRVYLD